MKKKNFSILNSGLGKFEIKFAEHFRMVELRPTAPPAILRDGRTDQHHPLHRHLLLDDSTTAAVQDQIHTGVHCKLVLRILHLIRHFLL